MILVTGGAGYIGSHFVRWETARGSHVVVLDDLVYGHSEALAGVEVIRGSTCDAELLDSVFSRHRIDAVVHFAALIFVGESVGDPGRYYRSNVVGTLGLLEAMRRHGVDRMVFSSTAAVYGDPRYCPLDEDHVLAPVSPYGETKRACEEAMIAYESAYGMRFTRMRYFNAAGADPAGGIGESHNPENHLIPLVLQVAVGKRAAISVFGDDYDTPDGTCIRDYVHVSDLAAAHSLALDRMADGGAGTTYNLGSEHGHSVREVIAVCERVSGRRIPTVVDARRPGDPPRLVASAAKARRDLEWSPRYGELERIVETAWRWEQDRRY